MDSPKSKGKAKLISVDTRQPAAQFREAKHNAVTQAMAVNYPIHSSSISIIPF